MSPCILDIPVSFAKYNVPWNHLGDSDDCILRWKGNRELEPDTSTGTIGDLFDVHSTVPHRHLYFPKAAGNGTKKKEVPPTVELELFVNTRAVRIALAFSLSLR